MRFSTLCSIPFAFVALLLTGCDGSPYPLSEPGEVAVRPGLEGVWKSADLEDDYETQMEVFGFDDHQYVVRYSSTDPDSETMFLRAFEADLDGERIMNVQCISCDEDEREWLFFRVDATATELTMRNFENDYYEELQDLSGSDEVRAALEKRRDQTDLFDDETWVWTR